MDKRIGQFAISRQLVERDQETARSIMGRCIIIRCESLYAQDVFEYVAISPAFDEISKNEVAPWYDVIIHGGGSIEFKRSNVGAKWGRRHPTWATSCMKP